ncbi:hypothetical protein ACIBCM_29555 [Streptomyces sp. NPDC051018]|uniref:hypothetical protein n=1 Tax=Streptomyces sp. NPDC051018 TaxID=3365639 RepID=UPI0037B67A83
MSTMVAATATATETPLEAKLFMAFVGALFLTAGVALSGQSRRISKSLEDLVASTGRSPSPGFPEESAVKSFGHLALVVGSLLVAGAVLMIV